MIPNQDGANYDPPVRRPFGGFARPERERMDIFRDLVAAQDRGATVAQSREAMVRRYGITESRLREIENEGIEKQWPPLRRAGAIKKPEPARRVPGRPTS